MTPALKRKIDALKIEHQLMIGERIHANKPPMYRQGITKLILVDKNGLRIDNNGG